MNRIKKAVQLDNLRPVDQYVQRSSSAVDTANIFHQVIRIKKSIIFQFLSQLVNTLFVIFIDPNILEPVGVAGSGRVLHFYCQNS